MSNSSFLKLINNYINKHDFSKCNSLLKKEIVYIYTNKVRAYNKNYYYSTTVELLDEIRNHLSFAECIPYIKFYNILNEDCMEHEKTYKLLDLYNSLINNQNFEEVKKAKIEIS